MVTDSAGTGMFLPFTVLYFVHAAGLTVPEVGVALTVAGLLVLPAPLAVAPGIDWLPARIVVAAGNLISCAAFAAYLVARGQLMVTAAALYGPRFIPVPSGPGPLGMLMSPVSAITV